MFNRLRAWLKAIGHRCWPSAKTQFFGVQTRTDTVVFVHGIFTHGVDTWGDFPRLLATDPDMPTLDLLLWCYPTGCVSKHNSLEDEGRKLLTDLQLKIDSSHEIFLVGHSMGGLIILKGLVERMSLGFAQDAPCRCVSWITLFASPLNGAWLANATKIAVGTLLPFIRMFKKHLRDLSRGDFVDHLRSETVNRIYRPEVTDTGNRCIPIRIVLASKDETVGKSNRDLAFSTFRKPQPLPLDEDHTSVKLPADFLDPRYRALGIDLQNCVARKYRELCKQLVDPQATLLDREAALCELLQRYGKMIRHRISTMVTPDDYSEAEDQFLTLFAHYGANGNTPPSDAANRAMMVLNRRRGRRQ